MSILEDYDRQTAWKYESIRGTFHTAESLVSKSAQMDVLSLSTGAPWCSGRIKHACGS